MSVPAYARLEPSIRISPAPPSIIYVERPRSRLPLIIMIIIIVIIIIVILVMIGMLTIKRTPAGICSSNLDCPDNLLCDKASGKCHQCLDNKQCGNQQSYCDPSDHVCKDCRNNLDCPVGAPYCVSGNCLTCRNDLDCDQTSLYPRCNQSTGKCVI